MLYTMVVVKQHICSAIESSRTATLSRAILPPPLCSNKGYDAADLVSRYINRPAVKSAMNARQDIEYSACSDLVDATMGHDVMKSVRWAKLRGWLAGELDNSYKMRVCILH